MILTLIRFPAAALQIASPLGNPCSTVPILTKNEITVLLGQLSNFDAVVVLDRFMNFSTYTDVATRHQHPRRTPKIIDSAKRDAPIVRIVLLESHGLPLRSSLRVVMLSKRIAIKAWDVAHSQHGTIETPIGHEVVSVLHPAGQVFRKVAWDRRTLDLSHWKKTIRSPFCRSFHWSDLLGCFQLLRLLPRQVRIS